MMRTTVCLLIALIAAPVFAADRAAEVRAAEIAFAKAFADRDAVKFFSFIADDAHFLGPKRTLNNKVEVREVWSKYLEAEKAPFSWTPDRVVVNAKGDIGLSTGPVYDANGKHINNYSSIWQRQRNGTWKLIFDGPGSQVCEENK